ncbi:T9SS type A sorting domain-containing protein [Kaistella palustris]|uniref:T9SS type A sorting domain-containing protein n=1 Tax=Kaistella palustris TaxID=493376 RepID=UPI000427F4F7|nr:T9SS type A sorting domain-containing protein [Kaistella palustris]
MKKISLLLTMLFSAFAFSQFVSPGTGITYSLTSLSAAAPSVLVKSGTNYQMTSNVTISAGDTLLMDEDAVLKIDGGVQLTVLGVYDTTANDLVITATDSATVFKGIRFEEGSSATFRNTTLTYGGGIQVLTTDFLMDNCTVQYFKSGLVSGASINFSRGNPVVKNSKFIKNDLPAVASAANASVALEFTNNYLFANTKGNSNRPQINMGPSGSGTTKILNNTIIGDRSLTKVGGVSVSTLLGTENHPVIEGNTITDNRYGITVAGNNSTGSISNNILTNNNTEPIPANGGSGISLNGAGSTVMSLKIEKNQIRGHLWGITIIGTAQADLGGGAMGSVGQNIFSNNGNDGEIYALYNNTANSISAKNNCWREGELSDDAMVEEVIFHSADNSTLGTVDFKPYLCAILATGASTVTQNNLYPNPSNGTFTYVAENSGAIAVSDMSGKLIYKGDVKKGNNTVSLGAKSGTYIVLYQSKGKKQTTKLIIK